MQIKYMAGDDWSIPVEFDRDITKCSAILRIKGKDNSGINVTSPLGEHINKKSKLFEVSKSETARLAPGKYKWAVVLYDDETDKRTTTEPQYLQVEAI